MSMPMKSILNPPKTDKSTQDASFSSHLNGGGIHSLISSISTHPIFLKTTRTEDGEIEVFDAEKYFKEGINQSPIISLKNSLSHHHQKDDSLEVFSIKEESKIGQQSARSESSWNIQSISFHSIPRNQKKPGKGNKKSFLTRISFKCKCPCADRSSVDIDDLSVEHCSRKSNSKSLQGVKTSDRAVRKLESDNNDHIKFNEPNSDGHFSFRVNENRAGKTEAQNEEDQVSQTSLEVMGLRVLENSKNDMNVTVMDSDDAIAEQMKNDSGSDASSDLFEIKTLSKGSPFLSRQASDGPSGSITPASTEWGIVAADFNAVVPDCEESRFPSTDAIPCHQFSPDHKISSLKEISECYLSLFSGCSNREAVSVAGDAQRMNGAVFPGARKPPGMDSLMPMIRFSRVGNAAVHL